ncbi:MAG: class I SAM-dependent methyltransferase [Thermodesulfobacteriota bacterium]
MKKVLLDLLICPACLPAEVRLRETVRESTGEEILEGKLHCTACDRIYPVENGIADLSLIRHSNLVHSENPYETEASVSAYLWSHYADLFQDDQASDAYRRWADLIKPASGVAVDAGAAVGRFTFELGRKHDFAVGIDTSRAFIHTARMLMHRRRITFHVKEEGDITRPVTLRLPPEWTPEWTNDAIDFIVGDAQAMPFPGGSASSIASLNLVDKIPKPIRHLVEVNRVARGSGGRFLFSDPFSWSEKNARKEDWLGGKPGETGAVRGIDAVSSLLSEFAPPWKVEEQGRIWWKIRTHANHYELIRSCYLTAER